MKPEDVPDEIVEAAARAVVEIRMAMKLTSYEWAGMVKDLRFLAEHHPSYMDGHTLMTDAFRDARAAIAAVYPLIEAEVIERIRRRIAMCGVVWSGQIQDADNRDDAMHAEAMAEAVEHILAEIDPAAIRALKENGDG